MFFCCELALAIQILSSSIEEVLQFQRSLGVGTIHSKQENTGKDIIAMMIVEYYKYNAE